MSKGMVHDVINKWFLVQIGGVLPPGLARQLLEPWSWEDTGPPDLSQQLAEPWTWETTEIGDIHNQIYEPWSS